MAAYPAIRSRELPKYCTEVLNQSTLQGTPGKYIVQLYSSEHNVLRVLQYQLLLPVVLTTCTKAQQHIPDDEERMRFRSEISWRGICFEYRLSRRPESHFCVDSSTYGRYMPGRFRKRDSSTEHYATSYSARRQHRRSASVLRREASLNHGPGRSKRILIQIVGELNDGVV
jgi:hypothetical protein